MKFDYTKLRKKIIEKYDTIGAFAEHIGKPQSMVSMKLSGIRGFTREDVITWSKALDIPQHEIGIYFFTLKV